MRRAACRLVAARNALRAAPVRPVNRRLALALRILASREAARRRRQVDFRTRFRDLAGRLTFHANELMKPFALRRRADSRPRCCCSSS